MKGFDPLQMLTIYIYICMCGYVCMYVYVYILGVARYTVVTVRYVPRFGGHGSIRFRYNMKKKRILLCSVSFHLF